MYVKSYAILYLISTYVCFSKRRIRSSDLPLAHTFSISACIL